MRATLILTIHLGAALTALADKLEPPAAAEIAKGLAAAVENPPQTDSNRTYFIGISSGWGVNFSKALVALANRLEPRAAAEIATGLSAALANPPDTAALQNPQEINSEWLSNLGNPLATLANKLERQAAAEIARRAAERLAAALENLRETDFERSLSRMAFTRGADIVGAMANSLSDPLRGLANKLEPPDAAEIAKGLAMALQDPKTNASLFSSLSAALAALADKLEPLAAAEIAEGLAAALQNPKTDSDRLSRLGAALAALANKLEPPAAAEIAKRLAAALQNPKTDSFHWSLGAALAALADRLNPPDAAEIAKGLAAAMLNLQEADPDRLSKLGEALAALADKLEPPAAAEAVKPGAERLASALQNPRANLLSLAKALAALADKLEPPAAAKIVKPGAERLAAAMEDPRESDPNRLLSLGDALTALANKLERQAAAEIARRSAKRLAAAMEHPQEIDSNRLSCLGTALAACCRLLPSTPLTHLLALSNLLLEPVPKKAAESNGQFDDRELLATVCEALPSQDLAGVLKYPFCTGQAEQIVLLQLKVKTGRDLAENVWKFVEQAAALGIKDVGGPAKRPSVQEALKELDGLPVQSTSAHGG
jgi:hypothetical protein